MESTKESKWYHLNIIALITLYATSVDLPVIDLIAGLTNDYLPEVITDRTILKRAREVILVADHTKCGKVASAFVAPLNQVNTFITDTHTSPEFLEGVRAGGVKVIVANDAPSAKPAGQE